MSNSSARKTGKVYLVGAGPGDPGLLTLRAVECLARADLILYDYLVNPACLRHARPGAETVCLGRHGRSRIWTQAEINRRMIEAAGQGQTVVRLKGGDPAVFARTAEELRALHDAGVDYEITPGVTSGLAAASCAGIPLTHHEFASAVALVTAQERSEKNTAGIDYDALARFPGTLVFYMGVTTAAEWSGRLIAAGKPPETLAAIVRRASLPDQRTIHCTLAELAQRLDQSGENRIRPPVLVFVGEVTRLAETYAWFEKRPLFGTTVLVTRPREQAHTLADMLVERGANVLVQPAIKIAEPDDWRPLDAALDRLAEFDWLVFSSANGVRHLLDRLLATGQDLRAIGGVKLAAIGPGTAEELNRYHLTVDIQPAEFRAESLADALAANASGKRFLLARASRGREVLAQRLTEAGGQVEQVVVYISRDVTAPEPEIKTQLAAGKINWITITSSAIARSLAAMFGEDLKQIRLASISPVTTTTIKELGYEVAAEAETFTMPGVVEAIVRHKG